MLVQIVVMEVGNVGYKTWND